MKIIFALMIVSLLSACSLGGGDLGQSGGSDKKMVTMTKTDINLEDTPVYVEYTDYAFNEIKGQKPFALFFHADWCALCKRLEADIKNDFQSGRIQNAIILEASYDRELELRKKYDINFQTTIILFDENGKLAKKHIGANVNHVRAFFEGL